MNNSEYILKEWEKDIGCYWRLNIDSAQKLYMLFEKCDGKLKDDIRDNIITGTLYLVPKYIRKSILPYLKNNSFDMNDIISVCNEEWIKIIDSGKIMKVTMFNYLFDSDFYYAISMNLVSKYDLYNNLDVNSNFFVSAIVWYVNKFNCEGNVSYDDFYDYFVNYNKDVDNVYNVSPCTNPVYVYNLIVKIYKQLKLNGYNKNISSRQIVLLKNVIMDCILFEKLSLATIEYSDVYDDISKKELEDKILDYIFNKLNIKNNNMNILRYYYGIDDGILKTFKATGDKFGMTRAGAELSVKRTLRKIREKGTYVMPFVKEYFED